MLQSIMDNNTTHAGQALWLETYHGYCMYSKQIDESKMLESAGGFWSAVEEEKDIVILLSEEW